MIFIIKSTNGKELKNIDSEDLENKTIMEEFWNIFSECDICSTQFVFKKGQKFKDSIDLDLVQIKNVESVIITLD